MGLACMRGLVEKFGERIVNESLDIFETYLAEATDLSQTAGIGRVILNMSKAASHRLLHMIKNRLTTIIDPFLVSEDKVIRELSASVYLTIFKRLGAAEYFASTLDSAFLQKLDMFIRGGDTPQNLKSTEMLLLNIKFMLETAPELKLEERIMYLCGVPTHSLNLKTKPLTKTHAVILRAIAPRVAPFVFSKKFY